MAKTIAGVVIVATALAGACSANPARSSVAVPLQIPEPPPRVAIAPVPAVEAPQPERPAPASPAPVAASPEPARPTPAPELRSTGPAGRTPTAAQVRESLGRAKQKLDLIDRRRLNAGKRADYDSARRFLAQAEAAVKANNLMLAQSSAEKAETLADGLK